MRINLSRNNGACIKDEYAAFAQFTKNKERSRIDINFQIDKRFLRNYKNKDKAIRAFISICEDAAILQAKYDIQYLDNVDTISSGRINTSDFEGFFLGLTAKFDQDGNCIVLGAITNLESAQLIISACAAVALACNVGFEEEWKDKIGPLEKKFMKNDAKKILPNIFSVYMFLSGLTAIKCESEMEYEYFMEWLKNEGFVLTNLIASEWNDMCKYIYCDKDDFDDYGVTTVKSFYKLPDTIDRITSAKSFMEDFTSIMHAK